MQLATAVQLKSPEVFLLQMIQHHITGFKCAYGRKLEAWGITLHAVCMKVPETEMLYKIIMHLPMILYSKFLLMSLAFFLNIRKQPF